ncbi:aldo/keto reductase [Paenibacillus cremeus]|uniref:Aldo/keto reductase n=1 Tax=Paenibacillus cremeus TaxID=2163881 RepID=A0A559JVM6_9BACL|nr:aldo/keto reductase [Paenibacillus cremeus]TVY03954.1 aldo/keto reductase [Paenibacillus cremeus]
MEKRPYGRTGREFPILSFGAQRIVDGHNCTEDEAIAIVNRAIDEGITYFDTAPSYSQGQSEERLGKAFGIRRNQIWITTKTKDRTRNGSLKLLEESLKRLQTDHVEEWRLHDVRTMEELDRIFADDGAIKALVEAREQGLVKHLSISGHINPRVQLEAIERFPFDSALVPLSAADHFIYSFAHEFVPRANEKGVAIIAMKVLGLGRLGDWYDQALRYAFSLPISTAIIGMESMEQLEKNLAVARSFEPMTDIEKLNLFKEIMHMTKPEILRWKAKDMSNAVEWNFR